MADFNRETLQDYLSERWGEPTEVRSLDFYPRGFSRQTWFIEAQRKSRSEPDKLVLRRDLEGNSIGTGPLRFEYDVYARLKDSAVPVAEVLWWEDEAGWAQDRPFYLRRQVEGTWDVPGYTDPDPANNALRVEIGREHIRKLALIHGCDWRALGFVDILPAPSNEEQCAQVAIKRMYDDLASWQFAPLPVITEVREWLEDNAPTAARISLLKGTNGFGEEIFRDKEIIAMSDWEQTSIGDPASDFARSQLFLNDIVIDGETVWGMQPALDYYEEVSGVHVPMASVDYYRMLTMVENAISFHHGARAIADKSGPSARIGWLATEGMHHSTRVMLGAVTGRPYDLGGLG